MVKPPLTPETLFDAVWGGRGRCVYNSEACRARQSHDLAAEGSSNGRDGKVFIRQTWNAQSEGPGGIKWRQLATFSNTVDCSTESAACKLFIIKEGPVAQRLEQGTHNPLVRGSNPCRPTKMKFALSRH